MPRPLTLSGAFDAQWDDWSRKLAAVRDAPSGRAIHDLRVGSRRLLALLAILDGFWSRAGRPRAALAALVDAALHSISTLRDAQVQRKFVAQARRRHPGLAALAGHLDRRQKRQARRAGRALRRLHLRAAKHAAARIDAALADTRLAPRARMEVVVRAIRHQTAMVRLRLEHMNPAEPLSVHRARVELKRLRYTVEIAARLAPALRLRPLDPLERLQAQMGDIQDRHVLLERLQKYAARHPEHASDVAALIRTTTAAQTRAIANVVRTAPGIVDRWTIAPERRPAGSR